MRTRWQDALDIQLDIHNFIGSPTGALWGAGWFVASNRGDLQETTIDDATAYKQGAEWAQQEAAIVFNAEPIWIDDPMMTLVEAAAEGFKPEPLLETDLLTPNGLLILPKPLWLRTNVPGRHDLNWSVAAWYATANGVRLSLYHDSTEPDGLDEAADAEGLHPEKLKNVRWIPTHGVAWRFGEMHPGAWDDQVDVHRECQAIWRLLNQTLAVHTRERPPSPFVKRAQRLNPLREHVTVVRLRRPRPEYNRPDEPGHVEWTHQWIVGGFWRWQWHRDDDQDGTCGHVDADGIPCHATGGRHRQIWISPFVKGPEGLPLIVNKTRMFKLVR
jgi:hypothetical protein